MSTRANLRYNAKTKTFHPRQINDELHIVELVGGEEIGGPEAYGFYPEEMPWKETPSEIEIEFTDDSSIASEVPLGATINQNQFSIDYPHLSDSDEFSGTGFVFMNEADLDRPLKITYKGIGTNNLTSFRKLTDFNIVGNLNIEDNLSVGGASYLSARYTALENIDAGKGLELIRGKVRNGFGEIFEALTANESVATVSIPFKRVAQLEPNKFFVVYNKSSVATARIVTINSDDSYSYGSEVTITGSVVRGDVVKLTDSKVAIAYADNDNSSYGTCVVAEISGSTITLGTPVVFKAQSLVSEICISALTDSLIVVGYRRVSGFLRAASISGTALSFGDEYILYSEGFFSSSMVALNSATGIVLFYGAGVTAAGTGVGVCLSQFTVSGTTIISDIKKRVAFDELAGAVDYTSIDLLGDNNFVVAYTRSSGGTLSTNGTERIYIQLCRFAGSGIAPKVSRPFSVANCNGASRGFNVIALSNDLIALNYIDITDSNKGKITFYKIVGGNLQFVSTNQYNASDINALAACAVSPTRIYTAFSNGSASGYLYSQICDFSKFVGLAGNDAVTNADVTAIYFGSFHLDLLSFTPNVNYYIDSGGVLTTNKINTKFVGQSVDDKTIRLGDIKSLVFDNRNLIGARTRWHGHAGYGSTNNKIPYFTSQVESSLDSINTIVNSSSLGWSMTVNVAGVYAIKYLSVMPYGGGWLIGFSINSNQLSTSIHSINISNVVNIQTYSSSGDALPVEVTDTILLNVGDVLRPHTAGPPPGSTVRQILEVTLIALTGEF